MSNLIAYKAFHKDEQGLYCQPGDFEFRYKEGEVYEIEGELLLCENGIHFCRELKNVFNFYSLVQWVSVHKVEILGDIIDGEDNVKSCTNKLKILEEVSFEDIIKNLQSNSDGVDCSDGVNCSNGVNRSDGVNHSNGVDCSDGVNHSNGVDCSDGVNRSFGVNCSFGVICSFGVNRSFGILNSSGVSNALFIANKKESYSIFGKEVSEERFEKVRSKLYKFLNGWYPTFNNLKSLYLKYGNEWKLTPIQAAEEIQKKEAWAGMPIKAIKYLMSLEEFDKDMFEEITGIDTDKIN